MANESYDQDLELTPVADGDDEFGGLDLPPKKKGSKTSLVVLICLIILAGGGFAAWQLFMQEPDYPAHPAAPPVTPVPAPVAANPSTPATPGAILPATNTQADASATTPPAPGTMAATTPAATPPTDANATTASALPPPPGAISTTPDTAKPAAPAVTTTTATVETKPATDVAKPIGSHPDAAPAATSTTATVTTTTVTPPVAPAPTTPAMPAPSAEQLRPIDPTGGQASTMIGQAQAIKEKTTVPLPTDNPGMPSPKKTVDTINAVNDILGQPGVPSAEVQKAMSKQVEVSPRAHQVIFVKKTRSAQSSQAMNIAGGRVLEAGQYSNAIDIYNKQLKKNPSDVEALSGKAVALQKAGRDTEAMAAYQQLLDLNPRDVEALTNYLGLLQKQNPDQALSRLSALSQQNPDNAAISGQTAMVYAGMQDTPNAIRYFQKAMALDPTNATYPFNLGVLYDRLGTTDKARAAYNAALGLAQQYPENSVGISADKIRERLQSFH
jgi:Flp pilus assembly protein TadD